MYKINSVFSGMNTFLMQNHPFFCCCCCLSLLAACLSLLPVVRGLPQPWYTARSAACYSPPAALIQASQHLCSGPVWLMLLAPLYRNAKYSIRRSDTGSSSTAYWLLPSHSASPSRVLEGPSGVCLNYTSMECPFLRTPSASFNFFPIWR
jgi:hypothetical protein